jgi:hypothetical protein
MRCLLLSSIFSLTATLGAAAADYPKGTYFGAGTTMCLSAPSGFSNDSKGNATIANGNNSFFSSGTFQVLLVFNGDGTGHATGIYVSVTPPPPDSRSTPKPAISAGTFKYDLTATTIAEHRFSIAAQPETNGGTVDFGFAAGQQYSVDVTKRGYIVSDDQKTMAVTVTTPYVETIALSGSPDVHTARSCTAAGNLNRMD